MSENRRVVRATPERVWTVLSDGFSYSQWVVGVKHIRAVDDHWPQPGARIHHTINIGNTSIKDDTVAVTARTAEHLVLHARGKTLGTEQVTIDLRPHPQGTEVTLNDDAISGAGKFVPKILRNAFLKPRNDKTLQRLAQLVEKG